LYSYYKNWGYEEMEAKILHLTEKIAMGFDTIKKTYQRDGYVDIEYLRCVLEDVSKLREEYQEALDMQHI